MKIKREEKTDRKTLSTRAHILLASLMEEEDSYVRGTKIITVMQILKEME